MKMKLLFASTLLLLTLNCFSQAEKIKQEHAKQASNNHPTAILNTNSQQKSMKITSVHKGSRYDSLLIKTNPKNRIPLNTKPKGIKKK